jgi:hypothetical protein
LEKLLEGFCVKLKIDAAFNVDSFHRSDDGGPTHDDQGMFIMDSCCGIPHICDASSAEARIFQDGLTLEGQVGCNKLVINSDCMGLSRQCIREEIQWVVLLQFMKNAPF